MRVALQAKKLLATFVVVCVTYSHALGASGVGWMGDSNGAGGAARYGYMLTPDDPGFNPEMAEREWIELRCDGYDGRVSIEFGGNIPDEVQGSHVAIFQIDNDQFQRSGPIAESGLFPGSPIAYVPKGDPLLAAIMTGYSMKIYVGSTDVPYPSIEALLPSSADVMREHLSACL